MKARILFLAAALTLAALPARAQEQTEFQELVAQAFEAELQELVAQAWYAEAAATERSAARFSGDFARARDMRERASQAREDAFVVENAREYVRNASSKAKYARRRLALISENPLAFRQGEAERWERAAQAWEAIAATAKERGRQAQEYPKLVAVAERTEAKAWNTQKDRETAEGRRNHRAQNAQWAASKARERLKGAERKRDARAWERAAQAWEAVATVEADFELQVAAHRERQLQAERKRQRQLQAERERQRQAAAQRRREAEAAQRKRAAEVAQRQAAQRQKQQARPVVAAYEAQARAWDAEADYDFVEYDGFNEPKQSKAAGARINAARAEGGGSFAREQASRANLHALRARENASDWRSTARYETGGLKELANKAAKAWESAAQAWEAVGE